MASLTPDRVDELARDYAQTEPFHLVEHERLETLPEAARSGELLWKDVEWIVRWYFRRHLDGDLADRRTEVEEAFRTNPWDNVRGAVSTVLEIDRVADRVDHLTDLNGIDVPVATAILYFVDPERDIVLGAREWRGLRASHELDHAYPRRPEVADYATYHRTCHAMADRFDADLITIQRALWRLGTDASD